QLRVAAQVARHHPVAVSVESDTHSQAAHHERVVNGREAKNVEEKAGIESRGHTPGNVVHRGDAKGSAKQRLLDHTGSIKSAQANPQEVTGCSGKAAQMPLAPPLSLS